MISAHIVPVLIISGAATAGMIMLALAPRQVSKAIFGFEPIGWLPVFFARYVGLLVFLIGCLLVYSALHAEIRGPVLIAAIVEKVFFTGFILLIGPGRRTPLALVAAAADGLFALLYLTYLLSLA